MDIFSPRDHAIIFCLTQQSESWSESILRSKEQYSPILQNHHMTVFSLYED